MAQRLLGLSMEDPTPPLDTPEVFGGLKAWLFEGPFDTLGASGKKKSEDGCGTPLSASSCCQGSERMIVPASGPEGSAISGTCDFHFLPRWPKGSSDRVGRPWFFLARGGRGVFLPPLVFENLRPPQKGILHYKGVDHFSTKGGKKTPLRGRFRP